MSTITALTVMGPSDIDASTTADAGLGVGIDGNGWVGYAVLPHISSSTAFVPNKVVFTVQDPGFDGSGATTVTRTIRGGAVLRRQYPNETSKQAVISGSNLQVYFSLEERIYSGSTITGVTCEAGYYSSAAAGAVPGTITNSSTLAYEKPLFGWLQLPLMLADSGGLYVEAVVSSLYGRNGQMVPRVEFYGTDGTNTTAAQVVTSPTLSTLNTSSACRVGCFATTIPVSGLNVGSCDAYAKVYPWIGDSSAVLDLSVTFTAHPTSQPLAKLPFYNDKSSTYGGAVACVKAGAAGGTVYHANIASARAAPFPTVIAAQAAIATFNNGTAGRPASAIAHNDVGGSTIYLMDDGAGGAVDHALAAGMSATAGLAWSVITPDPANTAAVTFGPTGASRGLSNLIRFLNLTIKQTASITFDGQSNTSTRRVAWDGCTINIAGTARINYRMGHNWWRNCTITGLGSSTAGVLINTNAGVNSQNALILGCTDTTTTTNPQIQGGVVVGNNLRRYNFSEYSGFTNHENIQNRIVACNLLLDIRNTTTCKWGDVGVDIAGLHIYQNVFESTTQTGPSVQLLADGTGTLSSNLLWAYNTVPGTSPGNARINRIYADSAIDKTKNIFERFNAHGNENCKTDSYTTTSTNTGRVGNWAFRFGVDVLGNATNYGDVTNTTGPSNSGASTNLYADYRPSPYAARNSGGGAGALLFVSDKGGGGVTGAGDYHLVGVGDSANKAYNMVPSGKAMLAFDLDGRARRNDGKGAAGAYERTDVEITGAYALGGVVVAGTLALTTSASFSGAYAIGPFAAAGAIVAAPVPLAGSFVMPPFAVQGALVEGAITPPDPSVPRPFTRGYLLKAL